MRAYEAGLSPMAEQEQLGAPHGTASRNPARSLERRLEEMAARQVTTPAINGLLNGALWWIWGYCRRSLFHRQQPWDDELPLAL